MTHPEPVSQEATEATVTFFWPLREWYRGKERLSDLRPQAFARFEQSIRADERRKTLEEAAAVAHDNCEWETRNNIRSLIDTPTKDATDADADFTSEVHPHLKRCPHD